MKSQTVLPLLVMMLSLASTVSKETVYSLPDFSMQLLINQKNAKPDPFQWPLVATTSIHLSSYMKASLQSDNKYPSSLKLSLNPSLAVDHNATKTFPNSTVIKAKFEGEVHLDGDNGLDQYLTQPMVDSMVNQAFKDSALSDLMAEFKNDSTLKHVKDVKVWVTLPTSTSDQVTDIDVDTNRGAQPNTAAGSDSSKNKSIRIAATLSILALILVGSISLFTVLQYRKRRFGNKGNDTASDSDSTSADSSNLDDPSVFSTEYWKEAWTQAAGQVKPRPPKKQRHFKRKPSFVKPNLDAIDEGEEEEDLDESSWVEEDWDESSWAIGEALQSYTDLMDPADNNDDDGDIEEASTIVPAKLEEEIGAEDEDCPSPSSSQGSFFKDEDPDIPLDHDKPSMLPFRRPIRSSSGRSLTRKDSDEFVMARNRVLAKKKEKEEKPSMADELTAVRSRVLLRQWEEKKEEPVVIDELTMVHQRILAKKAALTEEAVVTDELTLIRDRILSRSQHKKRDEEAMDGIV